MGFRFEQYIDGSGPIPEMELLLESVMVEEDLGDLRGKTFSKLLEVGVNQI